jgi:hypothetical protein
MGTMMRRLKVILGIAVLAFAALGGWRVGTCEVANLEFQQDLQDLASAKSFRYGNTVVKSEDEMREAVVRKASEHDIQLAPEQVTVRPPAPGANSMYLAADYSVPVNLAQFSFTLHFTPSSENSMF